jgi:hypothetical protein
MSTHSIWNTEHTGGLGAEKEYDVWSIQLKYFLAVGLQLGLVFLELYILVPSWTTKKERRIIYFSTTAHTEIRYYS